MPLPPVSYAISSQSDVSVSTVPTSQGQWELARLLEKELLEAGASDVHLSDTCVLTAKLPSNLVAGATAPAVGFCTHLDTVDVSLSPDVKAKIVDYKGGDICLNSELDVWLREVEHPEISRYAGQRVLVTDGTSVLGADTWYGADANTSADNWEVWKHSDFDRPGNLIGEKVQKAKSAPVTSTNPKGVGTLTEKKYCYVPGVDPRSCPVNATNAVDKIQALYTANMATGTGFVTSYAYDAAGHLLTVNTPGSPEGKYEYTYDARGNKIKTVQSTGDGQIISEADTFNAQNQMTSDNWAYDADGNLTSTDAVNLSYNSVNQNVGSELKDGSNATTNTFAGMSQKQLIAQQSSTEGTFVYTHGLNDRYGNPMIEKIRHDGATAFVEHDPVTGNPLFLRDTDKKSVHMYLSDPVDSDIRLVKDNATTANFKEFDPYGARDEITTVVPRDVFDPFRYRFGLVDHGGTGRYLFGVRFYDPSQGVWTQQDSLDAPLDPVNANRYAYAGGDPVGYQ